MKEVTKRNEVKWVKITHKARNVYAVAFDWKGENIRVKGSNRV